MNEKVNFRFFIVLFIVAVFYSGAAGFFFGRGNSVRPVGLESANRELTATIGSLRTELYYERAITGRVRTELERERAIAERIRIEQAEERNLIAAALAACRSTGNKLQGVIAKMEILNGLVRDLERRAGGDINLPGSE